MEDGIPFHVIHAEGQVREVAHTTSIKVPRKQNLDCKDSDLLYKPQGAQFR